MVRKGSSVRVRQRAFPRFAGFEGGLRVGSWVWLKRGARWAGGQRNSLDASSESSTSGASAAGWFFETRTMIRSRLIGRLESSGAHSGQAASTTPTMPRRSASDMCAFDMCSATKTVSGCASRNASRTSGKVSSCVGHPTRREGGEARRPRSGEPRSRCHRERPAFCGRPREMPRPPPSGSRRGSCA